MPAVTLPPISEKDFQAQVIVLAKARGWMAFHVFDSRKSEPGFPDLVLVHPVKQRVVFAELKTEKGKVTPVQQVWLSALDRSGQEVHTWRPSDWPTILRVLT